MFDFKLYVILNLVPAGEEALLDLAHQVVTSGADVVQLRAKDYPTKKLMRLTEKLIKIVSAQHIPLIINDRVDLVSTLGVAGVHLGQDDLPLPQAREILGNNKTIGLSTHTMEEALWGQKNGADYLALGPIFPTTTKQPPRPSLGLSLLPRLINSIHIPLVAIGGINLTNIDQLLSLGVRRVAIVSAIAQAEEPATATGLFKAKLAAFE